MNREIKFRGKGIEEYDKNKWYYGSYFIYNKINYFFFDDGSRIEEINEKIKKNITHKIIFEVQGDLNMENSIKLADVNPETVGQYTGLHDKNGKEIYEGDIVLYEDWERDYEGGDSDYFINKGIVEYCEDNCCYNVTERETVDISDVLYKDNDTLEVIGNIYDNPEMLKGVNKI